MNINNVGYSGIGMEFASTQTSSTSSAQTNVGSAHINNATHESAPQVSQTQAIQNEVNVSNEAQQLKEQKDKLNELAKQLNKELSPLNTNVKFGFSEDIEGLFVTVSERDTNRIIRKIPSDEAMELAAKMKELVGIIFNKQA